MRSALSLAINRIVQGGLMSPASLFSRSANDALPASYFGSGEAGGFWNPQTRSTLFQDENGVTPVTAYGDPVGLMLDQSQGATSLASSEAERLSNGTFDDDTGWSYGTGWAIGGGVASVDGTQASNSNLQYPSAFSGDGFYALTVDVSAVGGTGSFYVYAGVTAYPPITAPGTYTLLINKVGGGNTLFFTANPGKTATIDNVSLKPLPGNHATQSTSTARPVLARLPVGGRRNLLDASEDFSEPTWTNQADIVSTGHSDPFGGNNASLFQAASGSGDRITSQFTAADTSVTVSVYVKQGPNPTSTINLLLRNDTTATNLFSNPYTITAGEDVGGGWYRHSVSASSGITTGDDLRFYIYGTGTGPTEGENNYIFGAQCESGTALTAYQSVVADYDVTESGVQSIDYLLYDGTDDYLVTPSIDLSAVDEATMAAGAVKSSDAPTSDIRILEQQAGATGRTSLRSPSGDRYTGHFGGTTTAFKQSDVVDRGTPTVALQRGDVSGSISSLRLNGTLAQEVTTSHGTGNLTDQVAVIGGQVPGAANFWQGHIGPTLLIGRYLSDLETTDLEYWYQQQMGLDLGVSSLYEGAYFDPSRISTLYQDAEGTTPVTAYGDPVGLMLDTSQGTTSLSSSETDLIVNGTFDSDISGWTDQSARAVGSWDAGRLKITHNATPPSGVSQSITVEAGKTYLFTAELISCTDFNAGTQIRISNGTSPGSGDLYTLDLTAPGTFTAVFQATSADANIYFRNNSATGVSIWDNVSVKELPGNHATQSTSTARPVYARYPEGGRRNLITGFPVDDGDWSADADWTRDNATAPDGSSTAGSSEGVSASTSFGTDSKTLQVSTSHVISCYVKRTDGGTGDTRISLRNQTQNNFAIQAFVEWNGSGEVTAMRIAGGATAGFESAGDGWYRVWAANTTTAAATDEYRVLQYPDSEGQGGVVFFWGHQLEVGTTPTGYQKVTADYDITESGKRDISFLLGDGVDDQLTGSISLGQPSAFTVAMGTPDQISADGSQNTLFELSAATRSDSAIAVIQPSASAARFDLWATGYAVQCRINIGSDLGPTVFVGDYSSADAYEAFVGGSSVGTDPTTTAADNDLVEFALLSNTDGTEEFPGGIGPFFIINRKLSTTDRANLEATLANKAGVES